MQTIFERAVSRLDRSKNIPDFDGVVKKAKGVSFKSMWSYIVKISRKGVEAEEAIIQEFREAFGKVAEPYSGLSFNDLKEIANHKNPKFRLKSAVALVAIHEEYTDLQKELTKLLSKIEKLEVPLMKEHPQIARQLGILKTGANVKAPPSFHKKLQKKRAETLLEVKPLVDAKTYDLMLLQEEYRKAKDQYTLTLRKVRKVFAKDRFAIRTEFDNL